MENKKIVIIGAGGHAKSIIDAIEQAGEYQIVGFVEKAESDFTYRGYSCIGVDADLKNIYESGVRCAVIAIGYIGHGNTREYLHRQLKDIGYELPVIADKSSIIAGDVLIGEGTFIGKGAIINSDAQIGNMCIINSGAIVEHDCRVGDYSHVSVRAVMCGESVINDKVFVGANATLNQGIVVESDVIIGAGAVVTKNVAGGVTVVGVPARTTC